MANVGASLCEVLFVENTTSTHSPLLRQVLMMRQNLLTSEAVAANISHMTDLVHIDFYDNRLRTTILGLERLTNLRYAPVAFLLLQNDGIYIFLPKALGYIIQYN